MLKVVKDSNQSRFLHAEQSQFLQSLLSYPRISVNLSTDFL